MDNQDEILRRHKARRASRNSMEYPQGSEGLVDPANPGRHGKKIERPPPGVPYAARNPEQARGGSAVRGTLLFVDDEWMIGEILAKLFREKGYEVHTALCAHTGLRILGQHKIDVVITNIRMSAMNGLKMSRLIRCEFPDCAVIILTACGIALDPENVAELGVSDVIFKPAKIPYLLYAVETAAMIGPSWRSDVVQAFRSGASMEFIRGLMEKRDRMGEE